MLIALLIYSPDHQLRWQSLCSSTLPCSSNVLPIGLLIALIIDRPAHRSTCSGRPAHRPPCSSAALLLSPLVGRPAQRLLPIGLLVALIDHRPPCSSIDLLIGRPAHRPPCSSAALLSHHRSSIDLLSDCLFAHLPIAHRSPDAASMTACWRRSCRVRRRGAL